MEGQQQERWTLEYDDEITDGREGRGTPDDDKEMN